MRWVTATIALSILVAALLFLPVLWLMPIAIFVAAAALYEFYSLILPEAGAWWKLVGVVTGLIVVINSCANQPLPGGEALALSITLIFSVVILMYQKLTSPAEIICRLVAGVAYIGLLFSFIPQLLYLPSGKKWVALAITGTVMMDTAAYLGGKATGRHKLIASLSPHKTSEGAIWGFAGSFAGCLLSKTLFFPDLALKHLLLLSAGFCVFGHLGDLSESVFKRAAGAKDSGIIMPGHGGMLDRIDSLLFTAPFIYYFAVHIY